MANSFISCDNSHLCSIQTFLRSGSLKLVDSNLLDLVITEGYARDLTDEEIEHVGKDPFLIAYALKNIENRIVVTAERHSTKLKRHKRRIPNVCDDLGIMNCDQWKLGRDLDFRTDWMDS